MVTKVAGKKNLSIFASVDEDAHFVLFFFVFFK